MLYFSLDNLKILAITFLDKLQWTIHAIEIHIGCISRKITRYLLCFSLIQHSVTTIIQLNTYHHKIDM